MRTVLLFGALALMSMLAVAQAAGDVAKGKQKAAACAGCHGVDGISPAPMFPNLAGQHASYLEKEIRDFKAGKLRSNVTMAPMVQPLSEDDIVDIAAYFASRQSRVAVAKAAPGVIALGEKIYRGGNAVEGVAACMSCHGPSGEGNPFSKYPALSGQHADYTKAQLLAFRAGQRANDQYGIMRTAAKRMSNEEIEAVSAYIQGLH